MAVKKQKVIPVDRSFDVAYQLAEEALRMLKWKTTGSDPEKGLLRARIGASALSWGERVEVPSKS